jgi:hypothetical protein
MNRMSDVTKTVSLSLNFNDKNEYHFTVELPLRTSAEELWDLTAVNTTSQKFALGYLGKPLMRLLVELDHATKIRRRSLSRAGYWRLHSSRRKGEMAAVHAKVSAVKVCEATVEVSVPAACMPSADVNVIQGKSSSKAK